VKYCLDQEQPPTSRRPALVGGLYFRREFVVTSIIRLRAAWGGSGVVGPGVSTFYFAQSGSGFPAAVYALLNSQALALPGGTTITVPNAGETINDANGELDGFWSEPSGGGTITGAGSADYAAGVGMQIRWRTAGIVAGRHVQGSTFYIPIYSSVFSANGTLDDATVTSFQSAGNTFVASAAHPVVWSRPYAGDPTATPPKPARLGSSHLVTSCVVPDRVSWLRSRRT
jgi:hypothetical protein